MEGLVVEPGDGLSVENPVGGILTFKVRGEESGGALCDRDGGRTRGGATAARP